MAYSPHHPINTSRGHDMSMHYMYDMGGRPLYDVQGRPLMYGHQRAPTPQLPGQQRDMKPKVKDPPTSTSFKGRKVSPLGWISFILATLAFIMALLSFFIPLWATFVQREPEWGDRTVGFGLWHRCSRSVEVNSWEMCDGIDNVPNNTWTPGWFNGCRSLGFFAFITILAAMVMIILYIFVKRFNRNKWVMICTLILSIAGGFLQAALCVMFGVLFLKNVWWQRDIFEYGLSYCFGIACAAGMFSWVTAMSVSCELRELIV